MSSVIPNKFLEVLVEVPDADHKHPVDVHGRGEVGLEGGLEAAHIEDVPGQGVPANFAHQVLLLRALLWGLRGTLTTSAMATPAEAPPPLSRRGAQRDAAPLRQRGRPKEESPQDMSYHLTRMRILDHFQNRRGKWGDSC
jgi:hypothetical protein